MSQYTEMNEIKQRLDNLEAMFNSKQQEKSRDLWPSQSQTKIQIDDLLKQIDTLKKKNNELENQVKDLQDKNEQLLNSAEINRLDSMGELSKKRIDEFVEELLKNENVNIDYLPDFVERQIYRNTINITFKLLNKLFNTTSVKFMGHKLKLEIEPLLESEIKTI
ncbi:hypothetical protein QKU48_gp1235 [Fadolivirus algeromassiliense]|jgi:chromosome segregation ATPase|uniref:Uncharacterized protein n=1 Tax=Fadolivirus FV1/VV64 TaxID=3070911 RepID=A0A7D3URI4_9VIRU|nr:hypothetical protein QKU48_gp1235 [Fadolivirus algeromassiliense]QKF94693.1 hypothetical protein Fadolivirus_1_1235 [Fadolivirus FV1/VV64]